MVCPCTKCKIIVTDEKGRSQKCWCGRQRTSMIFPSRPGGVQRQGHRGVRDVKLEKPAATLFEPPAVPKYNGLGK